MYLAKRYVSFVLVFAASFLLLVSLQPALAQQYNESLFKGMKWRLVGPFRGGRVVAVAGIPGNPETFYFGAVAGGVWKTINGGVSWTPLFDKEPISSVGSITVAPSNPNILYVGTGEACIRGDVSHGDGVYRSIDGGQTWTNIGLRDTRHIGAIIVNPHNPDIVFVAALGHAYGQNVERGIFRTLDGGKTWEKVLYKDDKTGGIDVVFAPSNPNILFAALWQVHRTPYSLVSGGPGSGLYKSIDGGTTWKHLEGNGLPEGVLGRMGVSVSGADPNRVYALIEAEKGGLYRSEDGGDHWTLVDDDHRFRQRAWYFTHVFADPKSVDTVYVLNTGMFRSTDGGKTFTLLPAPHGDHHALWIDPTNPSRMINGNDGGATISVDDGETWSSVDNQPTAQFYHVITDNRFPYYIYGAQQDNTTVAIASRSDEGYIGRQDWYDVGGGESGYIAPDPRDPDIVYAGSYEGNITRFDKRTGQAQVISPWPEDTTGYGAAKLKYRFQWTEPIFFSPHDPSVLYMAGNVLFKTTNGGMSWTVISPDLTRNDKSKQQSSGGPITKDNTGTEYYDTIFAAAESPLEKGLIWAGSDDGLIHVTRDGGKNWADVTPKQMPEWSMISLIDPSPHDAGTAYVAVDRHKNDDLRPYIYGTKDYGKTWAKITDGIPDTAFVHAVREDPQMKGLLYAGTETGIFVSFNDGKHWQPLQLNLPVTPIHDLVVKDDDLIVATHGRSFWILDDIAPLRQLDKEIANSDVHFFKPSPAYREHAPDEVPKNRPVGQNPPTGAILYYYLKSAPPEKQEVKLQMLDSRGNLIRSYSNLKTKEEEEQEAAPEWPDLEKEQNLLPAKVGTNRFVWDLRYEPPVKVPGAAFTDYQPKGPLAVPGTYEARLIVQGKTITVPVEVKLDPRVKTSTGDLQKEFELGMKIRDRASDDHVAVNQIRDLRAQLKMLHKRLAANPHAKEILAAADALDKKMTAVEEELIQVKAKASEDTLNYPVKLDDKLISLGGMLDQADTAPTRQMDEEFSDLSSQLDVQLSRWHDLVSKDLADLNALMRKESISVLSVAPAKEVAKEHEE